MLQNHLPAMQIMGFRGDLPPGRVSYVVPATPMVEDESGKPRSYPVELCSTEDMESGFGLAAVSLERY